MAKIRLKFGENEIEVESKDFYVDNKSIDEVIYNLSRFVARNQTEEQRSNAQVEILREALGESKTNYLSTLEDAEIHEPEFVQPISIDRNQIRSKIHILARDSFFEQPRTVSEVVAQLREYGWAAVPLDVSKILANMALKKEIQKAMREKRSYYSNKIVQFS
jgi:transcription initiation factor IIE alpha subunit